MRQTRVTRLNLRHFIKAEIVNQGQELEVTLPVTTGPVFDADYVQHLRDEVGQKNADHMLDNAACDLQDETVARLLIVR